MKRGIVLVFLTVILAITSFVLPERRHTFLPPTNENELCQTDYRFFYAPEFGLCFKYASPLWNGVVVTDIQVSSTTGIASYRFFIPMDNHLVHMFTLYIAKAGTPQAQSLIRNGINALDVNPKYTVGYSKGTRIPKHLSDEEQEIDNMLQSANHFRLDSKGSLE